ncbi:helix-turn-helix transcriptional regulator [Saccharopolyspora griseoalba]|uniref:LuxR C-terminal-related transcriptional regulator n=1 Tax=Saccharopolyspora griseoalba TaxID=1431848 RepID=A0ABW2LT93_9PSEU
MREAAGNLPADVTSFVGRRREITLTKRMFAESRVVTLTGPGGVGKTRLAARVAANMRKNFRDKAWFVELEELEEGSLVVDAVIEQLGFGGPSGSGLNTLVDQLKSREMLLVLDNCEHVLDDAARLVDAVVRWCPGVRVLTTSRQSLGVAGEATIVVPPLQVPDPEHLPSAEAYEQYSSVRLFVDRARAVVPEFEVTEDNAAALLRLCHHLDGNPLAIELAAVRLRSLSLQQLEERLSERYELLTEGRRGAPPRQRTLRALIDWSYELVTEEDRLAWARMSVFNGSFDLTAAEHVAGGGQPSVDALRAVHSLVDKSVLTREEEAGEVRYRLSHTLREYGQEKLEAFGETDAMRRRHCAHYAAIAERFSAEWLGPEQVAWVQRLRADQGNLRAALHFAATAPDLGNTALRLVTNLWVYWGIRGLNTEARHWLDEVLESTSHDLPEHVRALRVSAWFALLQGDVDRVLPTLERATLIASRRGDSTEMAYLALVSGLASFFADDPQRAVEKITGALDQFRQQQVVPGELWSLHALGLIKGLTGEQEAGLKLLSECIQLCTEHGELYWRSYAQWATAQVQMRRDRPDRAEVSVKEALRLQRKLDNRLGLAFSLDTLAWIAHRQARHDRAAQLLGAASAVWDAVRNAPGFWARFAGAHDEHELQIRADLGDASFEDAYEQGRRMSLSHAVDFALELKQRQPRSTETAEENVHPMPLTRRERQIADLVAQGNTNKEIAENLVIAQRTVEAHVQNILTKLDFTSRTQIAGWVAGQTNG